MEPKIELRTEKWLPAREWCAAQVPPMAYSYWQTWFKKAMNTNGLAGLRTWEVYPGSGSHVGWHIRADAPDPRTWSNKPLSVRRLLERTQRLPAQ